MTMKPDFPCCDNPVLFVKLQRGLFSSRRKNIRNNLSAFLFDSEKAAAALEKAGIEPSVRAETLPVKTLLLLSDIVNADIIQNGIKK